MKRNDAKQKIIDAGLELISLGGYNATGLDAILRRAGVPKGSFYHYFGTKENFGLAVIDHFAEHYEQKLESHFGDRSVPPLERIRNYFRHGVEYMASNGYSQGCLIGNLGLELGGQNDRFRTRLEEIFGSWQKRFADCLAEARQLGTLPAEFDPEATARFLLSGWEGAVLCSKVAKSPAPMENFIDMVFSSVLRPS